MESDLFSHLLNLRDRLVAQPEEGPHRSTECFSQRGIDVSTASTSPSDIADFPADGVKVGDCWRPPDSRNVGMEGADSDSPSQTGE